MTGVTTETSTTTHLYTSPTNQEHHKALLSSTRTMPQPNPLPALNTRASLTPASSAPRDRSQPLPSMEFLSSVDQICIFDTQTSTRDGATLYVVETYTLSPSVSNIPTLRNSSAPLTNRPPLSSVSRVSTATLTTASTSEHEGVRRPDFSVRCRFSDFVKLRHEAIAVSCVNAHFLCQYCRQFQTYVRFHAAQPVWFVRIMTTKKQRKKILARFIADLVTFAQSRVQRDRHCNLRHSLPKLIESFLTD